MNTIKIKQLGMRLRVRRTRAQLSQTELATRSDLLQSRFSQIETGQVQVRPDELRRINEALVARMRELEAIKAALKSYYIEHCGKLSAGSAKYLSF